MKLLPEKMLRRVSAEDRKKLGKAGMPAQEALAKGEAKTERELQRQIINLLQLKGIVPIVSRMDRRTSNNLGLPDILFAAWNQKTRKEGKASVWCDGEMLPVLPCAWEVKLPGKKLEPHQQYFANRMRLWPNYWIHTVIHSVDEAISELRIMGIT